MEKPTKIVVDCLTGIAETTEMTDEELVIYESSVTESLIIKSEEQ